jgi:hypothetical protein
MIPSQITRPKKVTIAVKLLCIVWATGFIMFILSATVLLKMAPPAFVGSTLGFIGLILNVSILSKMAPPTFAVASMGATVGTLILLIYMIWNGRNWARITFLVLFIICTLLWFSIIQTLQILTVTPISGLVDIGGIVIQIIALIFLFQKPSSDWFREMRVKRG